jgi:hypothetical protein
MNLTFRWSKRDGAVDIFEDGVKKVSGPWVYPSIADKFYIGHSGSGGYNINAPIDSLRISNVARTDTEIASTFASNAPFSWDANTTYLQQLDDSLEAVCPFIKTITPSSGSTIGDYVDSNGKVHILAVSKNPADGVNASAVYTDYVRLRAKAAGSKNAKFVHTAEETGDKVQEIFFPGITQQLRKGNVITATPGKYHVEKDGTNLDPHVNNPYIVSGFKLHPGKNSLTLTEESGQGLWKVTARYKPKYY